MKLLTLLVCIAPILAFPIVPPCKLVSNRERNALSPKVHPHLPQTCHAFRETSLVVTYGELDDISKEIAEGPSVTLLILAMCVVATAITVWVSFGDAIYQTFLTVPDGWNAFSEITFFCFMDEMSILKSNPLFFYPFLIIRFITSRASLPNKATRMSIVYINIFWSWYREGQRRTCHVLLVELLYIWLLIFCAYLYPSGERKTSYLRDLRALRDTAPDT